MSDFGLWVTNKFFPSRLLVDTGDGQQPEYYDNLSKALKNAGVEISSVILTHWHHDHVGGILGVVERLGLEVRSKRCFGIK